MARLLIREAHGGETHIIGDGALPYFLNQGWVVLDTLDDENDASPLYLSKAEGDLRWARISDLGDPESAEISVISEAVADSPVLRAAFGGGVILGLGSQDDTAVIADAFAASQDKHLIIPPGATANLPDTLTVPAGRVLRVELGATVRRIGAGNGIPIVLGPGAALEGGGTIDADGRAGYVVTINGDECIVRGVHVTGSTGYGVGCGGWRDLHVESCTITDCASYAILAEGAVSRTLVSGNVITDCAQGILLKDGALDALVTGNIVQVTSGVGIEVIGGGSGNATIVGNTVGGTPGIGISISEADGCTVSGNSVAGHSQIGIEIAQGASYCTVTGNTVGAASGTGGVGIALSTPDQATLPLTNNTVFGNTIFEQGDYGVNVERGVNLTVSGNSLINCGARALFFNNLPARCLIADNLIRHTEGDSIGVWLAGTDHQLVGNVVDFTGLPGVGIVVLDSGHQITGNRTFGGGNGLEVNGAGNTVFDGNRTTGTTGYGLLMYGGNVATNKILSHISSIISGARMSLQDGANSTGAVLVDL